MAILTQVAGTLYSTYTAIITASVLDSIVNGNAILSDVQVDNSTAGDLSYDLSIAFGSITWAAPNFVGVYWYPLNQDGTTYGDNRFGSSAAGPPSSQYLVRNIAQATGAATGKGTIADNRMPFRPGKFVFYNQTGATLAGSGANSIKIITYRLAVA